MNKMDDEDGEMHPLLGAGVMTLFDDSWTVFTSPNHTHIVCGDVWGYLVLFHSRYLSKRYGVQPSRLCAADKLAIALEPWWLYLPRVKLSGEIVEYMAEYKRNHPDMPMDEQLTPRQWFARVQDYCKRWAYEHKDGREDTWTQARHRVDPASTEGQ